MVVFHLLQDLLPVSLSMNNTRILLLSRCYVVCTWVIISRFTLVRRFFFNIPTFIFLMSEGKWERYGGRLAELFVHEGVKLF